MIRWETCRREFEPDGALRDIYVHGTTIEHWRTLFDALRATYALEYSVDGTARPLPSEVNEAFTTRDTASPSLHFRAGGIVVACHFFTTDEIEFDISPREVTSQAALDELLGFLRLVGDTLGRAVIMVTRATSSIRSSSMSRAGESFSITRLRPNHALQRTRRERRGCNRCVPWAGSLSLGR